MRSTIISVITPFHSESLDILKWNISSVRIQKSQYTLEHVIICDNPAREEELKNFLSGYNSSHIPHYSIKALYPKKNLGLPGARNYGIDFSNGEIIMLLDADDSFVPRRVERQMDFMFRNTLDHCYGGYKEFHHGVNKLMPNEIIPPKFDPKYLYELNNICYCGSNCFTRALFENLGGFDENLNGLGAEDLEYWIRIAKAGYKMECLPEVLYRLGVHGNNMTAKYLAGGQFEKAFTYIKKKHNL